MTEQRPPFLSLTLINPDRPKPARVESERRPGTEARRREKNAGLMLKMTPVVPFDESVSPTAVYRAVYATSGVVFADGEVALRGALIRWGNGDVEYHYRDYGDAFPGREAGKYEIPERGRLVPTIAGHWRYESLGLVQRPDSRGDKSRAPPGPSAGGMAGGRVEDVFYIELLVEVDSLSPHDEALAIGRRRAAPYKSSLDAYFGPRMLGARISEEVGQLDDQSRYRQSITGDPLSMPWTSSSGLRVQPGHFKAWVESSLARLVSLDEVAKARVELACDWFWLAVENLDRVLSYLQYWFVLEILAFPQTTSIRPAAERLSEVLGGASSEWSPLLTHVRNVRGAIVHNGKRDVSSDDWHVVSALAELLIGLEFGITHAQPATMLRKRASIAITDWGGDPHAIVEAAQAMQSRRELDDAVSALHRAEALGHGAAATHLGILLAQRGDISGARAAFRRGDHAGRGDAANNLGMLLEKDGDPVAAEAAYSRADARRDAAGAYNLGRMFVNRGATGEAELAYQRADGRGHKLAPANHGLLLLARDERVEAESAFSRGDVRGDGTAARELGLLLNDRGETDAAEAAFRRADDRGDAHGAFNVGVLLYRRGDVAGAHEAWRRAEQRGHPKAAATIAATLQR